jgi:hypothetical protein
LITATQINIQLTANRLRSKVTGRQYTYLLTGLIIVRNVQDLRT